MRRSSVVHHYLVLRVGRTKSQGVALWRRRRRVRRTNRRARELRLEHRDFDVTKRPDQCSAVCALIASAHQSAVLLTSQTLTPAERACLTIFAVPRPPGNASTISGLPSANILLLRIGPAPLPNCPQSAWKTCTGTRLNSAQWCAAVSAPCAPPWINNVMTY